ncbi:hypothetical protein [Paenibacillus sp. MBLB4367]|uniref:hypothetical protein n=1 Tax=Paenibacillus sp. MBLB4367 TaxID=3384767 RepID=UPI0039080653
MANQKDDDEFKRIATLSLTAFIVAGFIFGKPSKEPVADEEAVLSQIVTLKHPGR